MCTHLSFLAPQHLMFLPVQENVAPSESQGEAGCTLPHAHEGTENPQSSLSQCDRLNVCALRPHTHTKFIY